MSATSNALIAAAKDYNLRERAIALAASMKVENPQYFVDANLSALAAAPVNGDGDTVASVFEYAQAEYEKKKAALVEPGKDMTVVTDSHIKFALESLISSESSSETAVRE